MIDLEESVDRASRRRTSSIIAAKLIAQLRAVRADPDGHPAAGDRRRRCRSSACRSSRAPTSSTCADWRGATATSSTSRPARRRCTNTGLLGPAGPGRAAAARDHGEHGRRDATPPTRRVPDERPRADDGRGPGAGPPDQPDAAGADVRLAAAAAGHACPRGWSNQPNVRTHAVPRVGRQRGAGLRRARRARSRRRPTPVERRRRARRRALRRRPAGRAALVGVRGAGYQHDGLYYVKKRHPRHQAGHYTQSFTLTREGSARPTPVVIP